MEKTCFEFQLSLFNYTTLVSQNRDYCQHQFTTEMSEQLLPFEEDALSHGRGILYGHLDSLRWVGGVADKRQHY